MSEETQAGKQMDRMTHRNMHHQITICTQRANMVDSEPGKVKTHFVWAQWRHPRIDGCEVYMPASKAQNKKIVNLTQTRQAMQLLASNISPQRCAPHVFVKSRSAARWGFARCASISAAAAFAPMSPQQIVQLCKAARRWCL